MVRMSPLSYPSVWKKSKDKNLHRMPRLPLSNNETLALQVTECSQKPAENRRIRLGYVDREEVEDYVTRVRLRKWNILKLEFVGFLAGSARCITLRVRAGVESAKAS